MAQTFPGISELKSRVASDLMVAQRENLVLARAYYSLIFSVHFDDGTSIRHCDMVKHILLPPLREPTIPDPFVAQVFLKTLKQMIATPKLFAQAITEANIPDAFFAFTTFPALFGYFTTLEWCEHAAQLITDLISYGVSDNLLYHITLSFLFSCFSFTDALWVNLSERLWDMDTITDDLIQASITSSISDCVPLISGPVRIFVQAMMKTHSNVLTRAFIGGFLRMSLTNWLNFSEHGIVFSSGDVVLEYLSRIEKKSTAEFFTSLLCLDLGRIFVLPSYIRLAELPSETLVFSKCDIELMIDAFMPSSSQIPLLDALKSALERVNEEWMEPLGVSFFAPAGKDLRRGTPRLLPIPKLPESESTLFDEVLALSQKIEEQELVLTRQHEYNKALDIQKTLVRLRSSVFEEYIMKQAHTTRKLKQNIPEMIVNLLPNCKDRRRLVLPTFLAIINRFRPSDLRIPAHINTRFISLQKAKSQPDWNAISLTGNAKYILRLLPVLYRRRNLPLGQFFKVISFVMRQIHTICDHTYQKPECEAKVVEMCRDVLLASTPDHVIDVFLFFEKILFREAPFLKNLSFRRASEWNTFFQIMWGIIAQDSALLQECLQLTVRIPPEPRRTVSQEIQRLP